MSCPDDPTLDQPVVDVFVTGRWVVSVRLPPTDRHDLGDLEAIARLDLGARRRGDGVRLRGADRALRELVELVGLADRLGAALDQPTPIRRIPMPAARKLFVNVAVDDVRRSTEFFSTLGFAFDERFCDSTTSCLVLSSEAFVMLLQRDRFTEFAGKALCDTTSHTETLLAISCASRDEVDDLVHRALAAGGSPALAPVDHGFMYGWSFYDTDGHHWEVLWMDPAALEAQPDEPSVPSDVPSSRSIAS